MSRSLLFLWGVCLNVGLSTAAMDGGQELKDSIFSDMVYIQNKAAPHDTLCLGSVFNSFTIFTADTCKMEEKEPAKYRIMPAAQVVAPGFDVTKAKAFDVMKIESYVTSNLTGLFQSKVLHIGLPGLEIPADGVQAPFITAWEDIVNFVKRNHSGIGAVMSFAIPPKAGAVEFLHPDDGLCNNTYNSQREADWPKFMQIGHFCIFKGKKSYNSTFGEIVPGMPCEDSVGSNVYTNDDTNGRVVIGLLLASKCSANPPFAVAMVSADFVTDNYYTFTPTDEPSPTTKWTRPTGTSPRHPTKRPISHDTKGTQDPQARAGLIIIHLPTWCAVIFTGTYLGL